MKIIYLLLKKWNCQKLKLKKLLKNTKYKHMSILDKFTALGKSAIGKIKKEPKTEKKEEKKKAEPVEIKEGKRAEKYTSLKLKSEEQPGESKEIKVKKVKKSGSA